MVYCYLGEESDVYAFRHVYGDIHIVVGPWGLLAGERFRMSTPNRALWLLDALRELHYVIPQTLFDRLRKESKVG